MPMKNFVYWTSTLLTCALMIVTAVDYWAHVPTMIAVFTSPNYPTYVAGILGVAKLLGVVILLLPGLPLLKEWAFAGFTFACVEAVVSSGLTHQMQAVTVPLIALGLLLTSYFTRPSNRRLSVTYRFEFY